MRALYSIVVMFVIASVLLSPSIYAQEPEEESLVAGSSEPSDIAVSSRSLETATFRLMFYWENIGWYAKPSLHWDNPSNFSIDSNGSWYFYAKRIANFRRKKGLLDVGWTFSYRGDVQYYTSYDPAKKKCAGQRVHSAKYVFGSVSYKEEKHNTDARGVDPIFAEKSKDITCASLQLWFY